MDPSGAGPRRRAEQWLSVAEKLLVARDLEGCKQFASQALAADPHTPGADDLHAAAAALLAAQRRRLPNGQPDPYAVLGLDPANPSWRHPETIHSHYRRLSLLLNRSRPDRPFSPAFAEAARLVADAWAFLSNPIRKASLDAELDAAAAAAAAARAYQSPGSNRLQQQSQSPLPARATPPSAAPAPWATPPPAAPAPWATQPPTAPAPRATPPPAAPAPRATPPPAAFAPRPTSPPAASAPRPTSPPAASAPRPTSPPAAPFLRPTSPSAIPTHRPTPPPPAASPRPAPPPVPSPPRPTQRPAATKARPKAPPAAPSPRPTQPPLAAPQLRPSPPPSAPQTPVAATVPSVQSDAAPSSTFWAVCSACCHIHQYDRQYERSKLLCPSCRQPFVAEPMAEPPPIVPGTDMYYCTWGFFPVGFPGCPGFERMVNSQLRGPDQLNAPWLAGGGGVKGNAGVKAQNGVPPLEVPAEVSVDVPAVTPPAKPMRVKVGAKKRGRPKGSKNKKKL